MFYIMKAYHLTSSGRKLGLKKIVRDEPTTTILVAIREQGYNGKQTPCFILGAQGEYNVKAGDRTDYTIDTGRGHKGTGGLIIEHVLQVIDGEVVSSDGVERTDRSLPEMDPRATWVMK